MTGVLAFCVLATASPCAAQVQLDAGVSLCPILISSSASNPEKLAAGELARYLSQITRAPLAVRVAGGATPNSAILVGESSLAHRIFPEVAFASLGDEEVVLKTRGRFLLVAGGRPRGTLYAAYRLLHREGVRWWTPWATTVPHTKLTLSGIDVRERPTFESRDPYWYSSFNSAWARRNLDNGTNTGLDEAQGGHVLYAGFVHTYFPLVPPEKHFAEHPEWYSLINGMRTAAGSQLCTTNPQLRDFVVNQVLSELKNNPSTNIVSVSQNDQFGPCECDNCKLLDDSQGSHSATVLDLANYVAFKIHPFFPKVAVDTLAYQYTRKAPRDLRPLPNVIVRLCSIECGFSKPLDDPSNASFGLDLKDWSRLTKRLYMWDYVTDFSHYMLPFPNWEVLGPNLRFFASHGVKGVFEEGAYQSSGASMMEMESWVTAQLLWNPFQDDHALIREFVSGYFGIAAGPINSYLRLMAEAAAKTKMGIWADERAPFLSVENVLSAEKLWREAEVRAAGQPDLLWRVKEAHLPIRYVLLSRWGDLRAAAAAAHLPWPFGSDRKVIAAEWLQVATGPGPQGWTPVTTMNEAGLKPQDWIRQFN